jgi:hypothetical protein
MNVDEFKELLDNMSDEEFLSKVAEITDDNIKSPELQEYISFLQIVSNQIVEQSHYSYNNNSPQETFEKTGGDYAMAA